ncbi:DUF4123 domain-containing protein, partial [Escherichia coli]
GLLDFLNEVNPPHCCLYAEPIQPDLVALAPYLVEVVPEVEAWLRDKASPWGIYLTTYSTMNVLRQHLRRYLQVLIPDETKPVLLRFYDPRNIWDFLSVLSEWEQHIFLYNIQSIATFYQTKEFESFSELHKKYPDSGVIKKKLIVINKDQYKNLEIISQEKYINSLTTFMTELSDKDPIICYRWARELFYHFCELNIVDRRSIECLTILMIDSKIYNVHDIPLNYQEILSDTNTPGHYRAERLLLSIYGKIPSWRRESK